MASVPDEEPLTLKIARGTDVMDRHEKILAELCSVTGGNEKEVEQCVVDYISGGYDYDSGPDSPLECTDDDAECLIDNLHNMWAEALPMPATTSGITDQPPTPARKVKPWSSRSSGSGTWVRDPKTGQMRNIDA